MTKNSLNLKENGKKPLALILQATDDDDDDDEEEEEDWATHK